MNNTQYPLLSGIRGPEDVRKMTLAELEALCGEIRGVLIETVPRTGGHLASNLGVVELSTALLYTLDLTKDKLIYDVGHQSYAHKLLTGRFEQFDSLRAYGGLSGFQNRDESPYDFFQTGHASTSVSAAIGFARAAKLRGEDGCFVAVTGDGALTGGMIYEALNDGGATELPLLVVINDNEMSIGKNVGVIPQSLSNLRLKKGYIKAKGVYHRILTHLPFANAVNGFLSRCRDRLKRVLIPETILDHFGFEFLGTVDGNDLNALIHAFLYAKSQKHPVLIHAKTKKGKGDPASAEDPEKYHSVPRELSEGEEKPDSSFSREFGSVLTSLASDDARICAVTAAMPSGTGLIPFREAHPDRFFDVGIAEEHAMSMSAALSLGGMKPVFAIYSTFLQRAFDQLLNDAALQRADMTLAIDRSGLALDDGMTHNGIYDVGYLALIPGLSLYAPANYAELRSMLEYAVKSKGLTAVRYAKGAEGCFKLDTFTSRSDTVRLEEGTDLTIVSYGMSTNKALSVTQALRDAGIHADLFKLNRVVPVNAGEILSSVKKTGFFVMIEEVVREGGAGEKLLSLMTENHIVAESLVYALPQIVPHGDRDSLEKLCGIDDETIITQITEALETKHGRKDPS
ncbi:MAG: 1-deoxy-D-xylulose-5-phosphate synthase [Clostridia bacterium]|nr:1-deoxy-D-xylulose-5-phosphate synthase [Clostridia bacterium]